jgi:hypothetical protein
MPEQVQFGDACEGLVSAAACFNSDALETARGCLNRFSQCFTSETHAQVYFVLSGCGLELLLSAALSY